MKQKLETLAKARLWGGIIKHANELIFFFCKQNSECGENRNISSM